MLTYAILKPLPQSVRRLNNLKVAGHGAKSEQPSSEAKLFSSIASRANLFSQKMEGTKTPTSVIAAELFEKHFNRFQGEIGDTYVFKRPKRPKVIWKVIYVETDPTKIKWSSGGKTPNYIQLEAKVDSQTIHVWTCENKIRAYKARK